MDELLEAKYITNDVEKGIIEKKNQYWKTRTDGI